MKESMLFGLVLILSLSFGSVRAQGYATRFLFQNVNAPGYNTFEVVITEGDTYGPVVYENYSYTWPYMQLQQMQLNLSAGDYTIQPYNISSDTYRTRVSFTVPEDDLIQVEYEGGRNGWWVIEPK